MMRILSILPFSPPSPAYGGAERQMHSLHKGLLARGVEIHVLADIRQVGQAYQEYEGVAIWGVPFPVLTAHPLRPGNIKLWQAWRMIRRVVLERIPRPELIQVTTFRQPAIVGYWLARVLDVPWVVRLACSGSHGDLTYTVSNWLSRRLLPQMTKSVSQVIALDDLTRQEALTHGIPSDRVSIIQNGLVFDHPPSGDGKPFTGQSLPILYLGRLAKQKCVDTLLTAFAGICERYPEIPALKVVGDGDQKGMLEDYAGQIGIAGRCDFIGWVASPEDVLEQAGCFVNPSEGEGLPNTVLEAAAYGLPLILSDIPVHRQIAEAVGMSEYLFPVGDTVLLAECLIRFILLDDGDKKRLSTRCAMFGQRFAPEVRDQAYYDLYCRLLAETTV